MRSVVFRFVDITAFSLALGETPGALPLPPGETVADGEWVLATFEIGSRRRATAAAARGVRAAGDIHIEFERRDWDRLMAFVAARSEHMRAARPVSSSQMPSARDSGIPSAPPSDVPPSELIEAAPTSIDSSRIPFGARILLVDDDEGTRDEVRAMLSEVGLVVEVVANAAQAEARLRDQPFDALVLDFHARGKETLALLRTLRQDERSAPIPVLFLSERPSSRDVVEAFASGADDFLPKPFRAPELGARIFGLLRRARDRSGTSGTGSGTRSAR